MNKLFKAALDKYEAQKSEALAHLEILFNKSVGIGDGSKFLVDLKKLDEIITISTEEAKERALRLAKEKGLFVGISAGANVLASERWIEQNKPDGVVVTILCDRGERYFSVLEDE